MRSQRVCFCSSRTVQMKDSFESQVCNFCYLLARISFLFSYLIRCLCSFISSSFTCKSFKDISSSRPKPTTINTICWYFTGSRLIEHIVLGYKLFVQIPDFQNQIVPLNLLLLLLLVLENDILSAFIFHFYFLLEILLLYFCLFYLAVMPIFPNILDYFYFRIKLLLVLVLSPFSFLISHYFDALHILLVLFQLSLSCLLEQVIGQLYFYFLLNLIGQPLLFLLLFHSLLPLFELRAVVHTLLNLLKYFFFIQISLLLRQHILLL